MNMIEQNVSLKDKTSFRIGGPAHFYVKVHTEKEIGDALKWANNNTKSVFILGKGSNILISDNGWPGLVLDVSEFSEISWDGTRALCQSGALLHTLVKESIDKGFAGIEKLAGIPGSVGGALIMNASAFKQAVSDCLVSVKGIECSSNKIWELKKDEIDFGYRTSSLKKMNTILLSAEFHFKAGDKSYVEATYSEILKRRNEKQPLDQPNCGSVFKNPEEHYAAELIEQCGLKGYCINEAMVSLKHANFIINPSNASASDVRKLIALIQEKVFQKCDVLLEPEVIFVGDFDVPLFKP